MYLPTYTATNNSLVYLGILYTVTKWILGSILVGKSWILSMVSMTQQSPEQRAGPSFLSFFPENKGSLKFTASLNDGIKS